MTTLTTDWKSSQHERLRKAHGYWKLRVASLIAAHCGKKSRDSSRSTSRRTQEEAYENVMHLFSLLRTELGFRGLSNPMSLDARHFEALAGMIKKKRDQGDYGAAHAAGLATYCRHLARWIGKPELVAVFGNALGKEVCKRQLIAQTDKSWEAAGVDPEQTIAAIAKHERWVAMALYAQHAFGLRKMEALMLQPLRDIKPARVQGSDKDDWQLVYVNVTDGSKGGRPRVVVVTDIKGLQAAKVLRDEIEWLGDREHLPPPWCSLRQNCYTYERTMAKFGLTRSSLGVTGHGLRAAYACNKLQDAGITPTVRGGDGQHTDQVQQQVAYKAVTEALGHGRISVVGAYAGSITSQGAARQQKAMQRAADAKARAQALQNPEGGEA